MVVRFPGKQCVSTAVSSNHLLYAYIFAALIGLSIAVAHAEAPKQLSAFGLKLGQSPALVQLLITQQLPQCAIDPSVYHESEGYPAKVTATFDIGVGAANICRSGPAAHQFQQTLSAAFAHPSIAASQPLYQIEWRRVFADAAMGSDAKNGYPFDKARTELFRMYGRPTDVSEVVTATGSPSLANNRIAGANVQREKKLVRYLWATKGHLSEDVRSPVCDCGAQYVTATLEILRSPSGVPKDKYFVGSLMIFVRDGDIGTRQDEWNAQWQKIK